LYNIESTDTIPPAESGDAATHQSVLGRVLQTSRWFALVRIWTPWLAPRHGAGHFHLSEQAILLSFLRSDGLHVVALAVNGVDDALTTFSSTVEGEIVVECRNDTTSPRTIHLLAATAWNFEIALCAVMYEMRKLVHKSTAYNDLVSQLPQEIKAESVASEDDTVIVNGNAGDPPPSPQWLQSWYDSLAYCTWNSLGQDLNLEKILSALDSFESIGVRLSTLIIDDNWQSLTGIQGQTNQFQRGWTAFEANPEAFPNGLAAATAEIRKRHPSIQDIAVWHALMGYWGCVAPDGQIAKDYKTREIAIRASCPAQPSRTVVDASDIHRMYRDFYTFLSNSGVTGVKTDVQFMLDELSSTTDRRELTLTYLSAWTQAHLSKLSGKAISCMSCIPQILYHSFLPTNTPRIMLRNSDDFFPDIPNSHPWHVFCNAHNALFVQHLNVLPDWDMFQSSHLYSGFHAASRCLSGGPIYITDTPGQHDANLIHEMSALSPRGQTVILRASNAGKTLGVYDKYDDKGILKIGAYNGKSDVGSGLLGVFNLAESDTGFIIPAAKIPGLGVSAGDDMKGKRWIIRSHMSKRITKPIAPVIPYTPHTLLEGTLGPRGYDIWTALPVHTFELGSSSVEVAVIGLLGKMAGACAIIDCRFEEKENGTKSIGHPWNMGP
jgi:Raffinose synthase or seed imbibition protein Sip1